MQHILARLQESFKEVVVFLRVRLGGARHGTLLHLSIENREGHGKADVVVIPLTVQFVMETDVFKIPRRVMLPREVRGRAAADDVIRDGFLRSFPYRSGGGSAPPFLTCFII